MIKVSILVPVYGVETYIKECAESLFAQTYPCVEFIFVDDCSPDCSMEILQRCVDAHPLVASKVRIVRHEVNRGLGAARQTGLDAATGDAVCFVDSDDLMPSDAIEALVEKMEETGACIVSGASEHIFDDRTVVALPRHWSNELLIKHILWHKAAGHIWAKLYRRELFTSYGIRFKEGVDYGEDYATTPRLLLVGRRVWTDRVVYSYRAIRPESYCASISLKSLRSLIKANKVLEKFFQERDTKGVYAKYRNLGMLDALTYGYKFKLPREQMAEIDALLDYHPINLMAALIYRLYQKDYQSKWATKLYNLYRRSVLRKDKIKYALAQWL
ncbi:glycosyltransferase family 2 protein [Hallella colorans]|uniref:Glycosyltransferase involved in cell wall biosynthesis n=1 Tax=Hallella colorans TaxID=1703337 RepID=A0A2U0UJU0_9BACT|nr:glycosyltransferase family 2 protein [Hallella colorans]PVX57915.1 glycosyltransferase involved in cell wall biosynthesis [Hallella colorans]